MEKKAMTTIATAAILLAMVASVSGCGSKSNKIAVPPSSKGDNTQNSVKNTETTKQTTSTDTADSQQVQQKPTTLAVYTGEAIDAQNSKNAPFLAVIENIKAARPQSGLSRADLVFETLAEGGIPRCLALFQSHQVSKIGPIRSDRMYFNEIANSLKLPFAHCGGSQAAIDDISRRGLMSLNEMRNGNFYWRIHTRKMPHNLYTSSEKLLALIDKRGYRQEPNFNIGYDSNYWDKLPDKAQQVTIKMSGYYTTSYRFDGSKYVKKMNGVAVPDQNNGEKLTAHNIIVQFTRIAPIAGDKKSRVEINLTGSGDGYAISNGHYEKIHWSKAKGASPIELMDLSGNAVKLTPGNTWWEIVDSSTKVAFNENANTNISAGKSARKRKN